MRLIEPMDAKSAIRVLEMAVTYNGCGRATSEDLTEALKMAKEALEKQIPKKARYVDIRFRNHGRKISDGCSLSKCYKCPNCGSNIFHVFDDENYCEHCGQAIDWEEGESNA